jgi:hypothetical protein
VVDDFTASATIVFEIDDQNKSMPGGSENGGKWPDGRARCGSQSVVNFLVSQIGENQKRPIKSELKRLKRSPEVAATYDDWPATPYLFQRLG